MGRSRRIPFVSETPGTAFMRYSMGREIHVLRGEDVSSGFARVNILSEVRRILSRSS
jgi:hypothetical protein